MNKRYLTYPILMVIVLFVFSGCETVPKKFKEEVGGIKTRVDNLESRVEGVESKQNEVERATSEQVQAMEELKARRERVKTNISVKQKFGKGKRWIKEIQTCLKNAGFYNGKIDGVKGKQTRSAVMEFQKANGLQADGVVGKKTWEALSKYTEGSAKEAAGTEEGGTK